MSPVEINLDGLNLNPDDDRREVSGMGDIEHLEIDKAIDAGEDDGYPVDAAREQLADLVAEVERLRTTHQGAVEAFAALEWNVQNGYDERSPVIVSRDSFERLRRALVRGR